VAHTGLLSRPNRGAGDYLPFQRSGEHSAVGGVGIILPTFTPFDDEVHGA
jgi:hypothetical protein